MARVNQPKILNKLLVTIFVLSVITLSFDKDNANDTFNIEGNQNIKPLEDTVSFIRNPAMGWGIYDDANDSVAVAETYWNAQDEAARKYASFFYIRWRWSDMEPEEGKYAWLYDDNFKKLVKGAEERGLKLAFRIYVNGQDNIKPATPGYVREAGAKGYQTKRMGGGNNWSPYVDDPIFQAKFSKFIHAFAKEFDNPSIVDFVDGNGLGWWGEGNNIRLADYHDKKAVFSWIINLYANCFKKVLLVTNLNSQEGFDTEKKIAYYGNDFIPRRDGLGSHWYTNAEKKMASTLFPAMPFIGESCYWGVGHSFIHDPIYKDYKPAITWRGVYEVTYADAINSHSNTLDLREATETKRWLHLAPDLVRKFMINGGYRFYPVQLSVPRRLKRGESFKIGHSWTNSGVGMCPDNNVRWNNKYQVAFALIQGHTKQIKQIFIDHKADLSKWIKGKNYSYVFEAKVAHDVQPGKYILGLAIIDTSNKNKPAINLAIKNSQKANGWVELSLINVIE